MGEYLFVSAALTAVARIRDDHLAGFTERHAYGFAVPPALAPVTDVAREIARSGHDGVIIALEAGLPNRHVLRLSGVAVRRSVPLFYFWPRERAVERVDAERLGSFRIHYVAYHALRLYRRRRQRRAALPPVVVPTAPSPAADVSGGEPAMAAPPPQVAPAEVPPAPVVAPAPPSAASSLREQVERLLVSAAPVPLPFPGEPPSAARPLAGAGVYLRTDFWASLTSGGSYGHTCYVAQSLARMTERLTCLMANRYPLLDEMGLDQIVVRPGISTYNEIDLIAANEFYYDAIKSILVERRPRYVYERLCLGNVIGTRLSAELGIPYIVEYNGSELSMRRSFGAGDYEYGALFEQVELAAFRQATMISVISRHVRDDVVKRGIDPRKVLINPNAVDPAAYAPAAPAEFQALRRELGIAEPDRVIGFIGTFGGWHGIDVLAEAMPRICAARPAARFLLIGDGNFKHLVHDAVLKHGLQPRVIDVGRVDQQTGARLLKAADILVSPHSSHMVDSPFFGSPTKLFEYMALGAGIVASDLEQLGEVLSPALRPDELAHGATVGGQRAVLVRPGDAGEFVAAVGHLIDRPEVAAALGRNARDAAIRYYSWDQHVTNLWLHLAGRQAGGFARDQASKGRAR